MNHIGVRSTGKPRQALTKRESGADMAYECSISTRVGASRRRIQCQIVSPSGVLTMLDRRSFYPAAILIFFLASAPQLGSQTRSAPKSSKSSAAAKEQDRE